MNDTFPAIYPLSERGLLVVFSDSHSRETGRRILAFDHAITSMGQGVVVETVPALRSILVMFDAARASSGSIEKLCHVALANIEDTTMCNMPRKRTYLIPAVYGDDAGPDIDEAVEQSGLDRDEFIAMHSSCVHDVACLGFAPGLAYLTGLPPPFDIARNRTAGRPVPAGSLLVANRQTVFTSTSIPTGWKRIATSPVIGFQPDAEQPFLLAPGDQVRFQPVDRAFARDWSVTDNWSDLAVD